MRPITLGDAGSPQVGSNVVAKAADQVRGSDPPVPDDDVQLLVISLSCSLPSNVEDALVRTETFGRHHRTAALPYPLCYDPDVLTASSVELVLADARAA
jgi:hypothetical protein